VAFVARLDLDFDFPSAPVAFFNVLKICGEIQAAGLSSPFQHTGIRPEGLILMRRNDSDASGIGGGIAITGVSDGALVRRFGVSGIAVGRTGSAIGASPVVSEPICTSES